jgi:hypothetical protein
MATDTHTMQERIDRELAREREERHKNDEAKAGVLGDDDARIKDARASTSSSQLHRPRGR